MENHIKLWTHFLNSIETLVDVLSIRSDFYMSKVTKRERTIIKKNIKVSLLKKFPGLTMEVNSVYNLVEKTYSSLREG